MSFETMQESFDLCDALDGEDTFGSNDFEDSIVYSNSDKTESFDATNELLSEIA